MHQYATTCIPQTPPPAGEGTPLLHPPPCMLTLACHTYAPPILDFPPATFLQIENCAKYLTLSAKREHLEYMLPWCWCVHVSKGS